jgi:maleate isomerase
LVILKLVSPEGFRIGLLVPSSNTTMEPDFYSMVPNDISVHTARMRLVEVNPDGLLKMAEDAERGASLLSSAGVNVIVYGCTTGSLVGGVDWERDLTLRISDKTGIRTISTGGAVVEALCVLGGKRIGVVTPYSDVLNSREAGFLTAKGLEVSEIKGLGLINNLEIGRVSSHVIEGLVKDVESDADVIFISCTNLPVIKIIEKLEKELNKPVVTSNQASLWAALLDSNITSIPGYGALLREKLSVTG